MIKILFVSKTFGTGGAGIAATRIWRTLQGNKNIKPSFLSQEQPSLEEEHTSYTSQGIKKYTKQWKNFIFERLYFLPHEKDKSIRYAFSPAAFGEGIDKNKLFQEADIIHLHWFNQGFLSLRTLNDIIQSGKPIIWTLHDQWAFTGGCHVALSCLNYHDSCGNCLYLKNPGNKDLSSKHFQKKKAVLKNSGITFVCCSNWLMQCAKNSSILGDEDIRSIPNPIDVAIFKPLNRVELKTKSGLNQSKKYILFGAANASNVNKGIAYIIKGIQLFCDSYPELANQVELLIVGKSKTLDAEVFPLKVHKLGVIKSQLEMAHIYNIADTFVLPTLMDNLPNMVMESMACGTVPVSFNVGGVPQLIDHKKNGYIAEYKSHADLARGIYWALTSAGEQESKLAREKVLDNFSEERVAEQYQELYQTVINK